MNFAENSSNLSIMHSGNITMFHKEQESRNSCNNANTANKSLKGPQYSKASQEDPSAFSIFSILHSSHIAIVGMNCVGESTAELLLKNEVQHLTLVDNRQIRYDNFPCVVPSSCRKEGTYAVDQIKTYLKMINPSAEIKVIKSSVNDFIAANLRDSYNFIVDTSSSLQDKLSLISVSLSKGIPIISCMDTGQRINPSKVKEDTLQKAAITSKMAETIMSRLLQQHFIDLHKESQDFSLTKGAMSPIQKQKNCTKEKGEIFISQQVQSISEQICNLPVVFSNENPRNTKDGLITEQCLSCKCPPFVSRQCQKRRLSDTCNVYVTSMAAMLITRNILSRLLQK